MSESFHGGELKAVVVPVRAVGKLCNGTKPWIFRLEVRKCSKTALANRLITVHLRQVWLVHRTRPDILRLHTGRTSELMFDPQAPLHEVRRMEFTVRHRRDLYWRKACCRACLWRRT